MADARDFNGLMSKLSTVKETLHVNGVNSENSKLLKSVIVRKADNQGRPVSMKTLSEILLDKSHLTVNSRRRAETIITHLKIKDLHNITKLRPEVYF